MIDRDQRLAAAIAFAAQGWPVHPCRARKSGRFEAGTPLLPREKDAQGKPIPKSGGLAKASIDKSRIREYWTRWPDALIGVCTGATRLFVLDFDPRIDADTGEEWTLERLKAETETQIGCALPASLTSRTPSAGVHLWLRWPDDGGEAIRNSGSLPKHVDVRGAGGYVIAPPGERTESEKKPGGAYRWIRGADEDGRPDFGAIAEAPAGLVRILRAGKGAQDHDGAHIPAAQSGKRGGPGAAATVDAAVRKYALSALDGAIRAIETARSGSRNETLNREAYGIASLVAAGALSEGVEAELLAAGHRNPGRDDRAQIEATFASGWAAGIAAPRDLKDVAESARRWKGSRLRGAAAPDPGRASHGQDFHNGSPGATISEGGRGGGRIRTAPDAELDRACAFLPMTDLGNAERFRARFGRRFRFCRELGWFAWDGRRWALLSEEKDKTPGEVQLAVFATVRAIRNEAKLVKGDIADFHLLGREPPAADDEVLDWIVEVKGSERNPKYIRFSELLEKHAKASESAAKIGCIANLAKAFEDIAIGTDAMDRDPMAINVQNGTLRIEKAGPGAGDWRVRLDPHEPGDLISKIANVAYDPAAACPEFDGFLETVQPHAAVRRFLLQAGGLSLTGDVSEQVLFFNHGKGRNGKSTFMDALSHVIGDYAGSIPIESFLDQGRARKGGEATPDLARLPGVRFLRTSEPEKGAKLAEALIKLATGGEEMSVRFLNRGFFDFYPEFKLFISGNHKPRITGHDDGIWRRVKLVPWDVQIEQDKVDGALPEKLRAEASGIFNRMIAGLIDWRASGLTEPSEVSRATAKYREQSDQLGRFLHQCTRETADGRAKSSLLLELFNAWVVATGGREWKPAGFSDAMEQRGYEKKLSNGVQWLGLEMTMTVQDVERGDWADEPGPDPGGEEDDGVY